MVGVMRVRCSILNEIFGTSRNCRAYGIEKPMCVMGKAGRYVVQRGRYFAAQMPRTMRVCHGRLSADGTEAIVEAMQESKRAGSEVTLISRRSQVCVFWGFVSSDRRSERRGMGSWGALRVRWRRISE